MSDRLTPKQERFVNGLVSGMSQREAYLNAYNTQRMKSSTIDERASRLRSENKVSARYDELVAEAAKAAVFDRQKAIAALTEIVDIGLLHIRQTAEHRANMTDKNSRELADLPRGAATVISAIEKLDRLLRLSDAGDGTGEPVLVDDFAEPDR
jgi:hypothetical protein